MYIDEEALKKVVRECNTDIIKKQFKTEEIYSIIVGIVCVFLMFFLTICYTSRQKTERIRIERSVEYNQIIESEE